MIYALHQLTSAVTELTKLQEKMQSARKKKAESTEEEVAAEATVPAVPAVDKTEEYLSSFWGATADLILGCSDILTNPRYCYCIQQTRELLEQVREAREDIQEEPAGLRATVSLLLSSAQDVSHRNRSFYYSSSNEPSCDGGFVNKNFDTLLPLDLHEAIGKIFYAQLSHGANVLHTRVGKTEGVSSMKPEETTKTINLYGLRPSSELREAPALHRLLRAKTTDQMRISNKVFDAMIFPPLLDMRETYDGVKSMGRIEREEFSKFIQYLRPGANIAMILPFYRLSKDLCEHMARWVEDVTVFGSEEAPRAVCILGRLMDRNTVLFCDDTYNTLRLAGAERGQVMSVNEILQDRYMPLLRALKEPQEIPQFRSTVVFSEDAADMVAHSGAFSQMLAMQTDKGTEGRRPLLPFNRGQIGLVLASGCMDGIVRDDNGGVHLIKGRIVRTNSTITATDSGTKTSVNTTTHASKVEINALMPDGTHYCFA